MSQIFVRLSSSFAQIILLVFLSLCLGHPGAATCQSGGPGAPADPAWRTSAIADIGEQTTIHKAPDDKSKKDPFILTEVEPLLLLLFGLILFAVATGIKLKLSRVNRASSQYFEPLVSQTASRSETRS
ncbi:MAG TPA: hypothetical protein VFV58_15620 [Blastocatellia bacterium]|jgi:hypothetical protein|nr:hypothetical protein [Blastocatellia bacterium]